MFKVNTLERITFLFSSNFDVFFFVEWIVLLVKCRHISSINIFFVPPPPPPPPKTPTYQFSVKLEHFEILRILVAILKMAAKMTFILKSSIILGISSLSSKLGKCDLKMATIMAAMAAIFNMVAKTQFPHVRKTLHINFR
jgi:hypothetical protein